ncbi:TPA: hypothetical protein ACGCBI_002187 [Serratia marcescens]|uniref:hypothetical protein n=1 Tax=Serratia marcescens TaxID=615 RepID=UPI0011C46ED0|nr:hypothetical protein [Serratia marcescens]MBH2622918.1 hypothetical protein [Serratia marcescens]MBN5442951.1 hypothetical protein [Serratia marcescens]
MNNLIKITKVISGIGSVLLIIVVIGFLSDNGIPYRSEDVALLIITVLTSVCTLFNLSKSDVKSDEGILSLWLKRKRLEEKKRIADLEK